MPGSQLVRQAWATRRVPEIQPKDLPGSREEQQGQTTAMSRARIIVLTSLAMLAFAGNSLLCRIALKQTSIDAASFTTIRILSGAIALWFIVKLRTGSRDQAG